MFLCLKSSFYFRTIRSILEKISTIRLVMFSHFYYSTLYTSVDFVGKKKLKYRIS